MNLRPGQVSRQLEADPELLETLAQRLFYSFHPAMEGFRWSMVTDERDKRRWLGRTHDFVVEACGLVLPLEGEPLLIETWGAYTTPEALARWRHGVPCMKADGGSDAWARVISAEREGEQMIKIVVEVSDEEWYRTQHEPMLNPYFGSSR